MKNNGTENGKQYKPLKKIYLIGGTMRGRRWICRYVNCM